MGHSEDVGGDPSMTKVGKPCLLKKQDILEWKVLTWETEKLRAKDDNGMLCCNFKDTN